MDDRLVDLLTRLRARVGTGDGATDIEALLASEGYDGRQIGEILALLFADIPSGATGRTPVVQRLMTFRVMGPHERGRFAPDAWGHLLSLSGSGTLSAAELEHVIERALTQFDGRIALDDLRTLLDGGGPEEQGPPTDHVTVH